MPHRKATTKALLITLLAAALFPTLPAHATETTTTKAATAAPEEHKVETAEGITLRVRTMGEGDPVVLLSGGPGFAGEQMWPIATYVAKTNTAIVPDQRGTGQSKLDPFDPAAFSIDTMVQDLEALRIHLGHDAWTLVGHSWGSILSMAYAAQHPDHVTSLVLVSPAGIESSFWSTYQTNLAARITPEMQAEMAQVQPTEQTLEAFAEMSRAYNKIMAPAMVENESAIDALRAEMSEDNMNPMVGLAMQQSLMSYDLRPDLTDFNKPTLVIQGDADPIGRETADRITETIASAKLETIENCGHWPFLETPKALESAITAFLAKPQN